MSRPKQQKIRVLVTRPDHLGDALLTLPMLAALKRALVQVHLACLLSESTAAVSRHCPYVDETLCAMFPPLDAPLDPAAWAVKAAEQGRELRGRFDIALLPRPDDPWSGPLVQAAEVPIRLGYDTPRTLPFLTHAQPFPGKCHVSALGLRLADAAVRLLGGQPGDHPVDTGRLFVWSGQEEGEALRALSTAADRTSREPVLLHPGAGWPIKRWPAARWGELAAQLAERLGIAPVVITGPGEDDLLAGVIADSGGSAVPLRRPLSLGAMAALQARARLVIGIDSGPVHLAAILGRPVVALYGPADPLEFSPLGLPHRHRIVRVQLPCSPCGTLLDPPCGVRTEPACVVGISVEAVLEAALDCARISSSPGAFTEGRAGLANARAHPGNPNRSQP